MADVFLFIRQGWKNLWKLNSVWLFSALPLLDQVFHAVQINDDTNLLWSGLTLAETFVSIILSFVSFVAVRYLVYSFTTGRAVSVQEVLSATRKFAGRTIGCSCLGVLILFPCMFLIAAFPIYYSGQPVQISDKAILMFLPLSIFMTVFDFTLVGFFANDWGVRQSLKNAWALFGSHFHVLATLGIMMMILLRLYGVASGALTVLIQSGFDIASLSKLNYIDPFTSLSNNLLFVLLNGIGQTIFIPFSASVFILAYLKYSSKNTLIARTGGINVQAKP